MNRSFIGVIILAACTVLATSAVFAASVLDFDGWMRKIDKKSQSVQRNIALKNASDTIADAKDIEELYKLMEDYFVHAGNASDAVKLSEEGGELARTIAKSVENNDYETSLKAALEISAACRNCHDSYKPFK